MECVLVGPLLNTKTVGGGDPPVGCASTVRYSAVSNTGCIFRVVVQIWSNVWTGVVYNSPVCTLEYIYISRYSIHYTPYSILCTWEYGYRGTRA